MLFLLDWEDPSPSKIVDQKYSTHQLPFHISEIKCYVLRSVKCKIYLKLGISTFIVNLWCHYLRMYWVWIIYL